MKHRILKRTQSTAQLHEFDRLAIGYLSLTGLIFLVYAFEGVEYLQFGVIHWICLTLIYWLATRSYLPHPMQILRYCYPVALLMLFYYEVHMLSQLIYDSPVHYDSLIVRWERILIGSNPHTYWFRILDGRFWAELFHLLYFSYYPLLICSYVWVWACRPDDFNRFAFVYLGIFITFVVIFAFFPVYGPVDFRADRFNDISFFSRVIEFLFAMGESPGGAFPSSHVGQSIGIYLLLRPLDRGSKLLVWGIIIGIGLSMIYGSIHYALDAVGGLVAGLLFYLIWNRVYKIVENGTSQTQG